MVDFDRIREFMTSMANYCQVALPPGTLNNPRMNKHRLSEVVQLQDDLTVFDMVYRIYRTRPAFVVSLYREFGRVILDDMEMTMQQAMAKSSYDDDRHMVIEMDALLHAAGEYEPHRYYDLIDIMQKHDRPKVDINGVTYYVPEVKETIIEYIFDPTRQSRILIQSRQFGESWSLDILPDVGQVMVYIGSDDIDDFYQPVEVTQEHESFIGSFFEEVQSWYHSLVERGLI